MKRLTPWLTVVGLVLSLFGCSPSPQASAAPTQPDNGPVTARVAEPTAPAPVKPRYETDEKATFEEYKRRHALRKQFQDPLVKILKAGGSQKHADVYNFYVKHGRLSLPTANNALAVELQEGDRKPDGTPRDDLFATIILLPEDSALGYPWQGILEDAKAIAVYMVGDRTLVLSPEAAGSDEGKAFSLLHESFHVWEHLKLGRKLPDGDAYQFCRGEVEAHEFVNELAVKVHPALDTLIDKISSKIGGVQQGSTITVQSNAAFFQEIRAELPVALGRSIPSQSELGALSNDVWYLANFRSIDRRTPKPQRLDAKIAWLKGYLESTGNMQWIPRPKR